MTQLPEYHNIEQVKAAVATQRGVIETTKAQLAAEEGVLAAIRKMCPHAYSKRYSCGRDAGDRCDICGDWR